MNITKKHRRYLFIYVVNVPKNLVGEEMNFSKLTLFLTKSPPEGVGVPTILKIMHILNKHTSKCFDF